MAFRVTLALYLLSASAAAGQVRYADPRACAACHAEIARTYAETGMGRSFFRPAPSKSIEDYTAGGGFYHSLSDTHYSMTFRAGAYYQRRWQTGLDGKERNAEESRIDYVLGSGNHARSYLHLTARGTLIELPLGWYAEAGGGWGMNPGFDSRHPATRRLISYECMFCHNGYPRIPAGHETLDSEPVFSGDLPEGIDCQRCHGPGLEHIRLAQAAGGASARDRIRAAIVNPARLRAKLRMDLCMQCHLQPTSAAVPVLIRRFDRGPFSFQPGEPLSAFVLAFDYPAGDPQRDDRFEIVGSAAYRLRKSRCFLESKDALRCETCHDPHRTVRGPEAVQRQTQVCRQCHGAAALSRSREHASAAPEAGCAGCHMPKRRTQDVVHVVMTDHLIERRPPPEQELLAELKERHPRESGGEYRGEVVAYYPRPAAAGDALYLALAQVAMKNNLETGVPRFARLVAEQRPPGHAWYLELGDAWLAIGDPAKAVAAYQEAVRRKPRSPSALLSMAKALKAAGQIERAGDVLRRATTIAPDDARLWYQSALLASEQGRTAEGIERMGKSIALDPDLPGAYTTLGGMQVGAGQNAAAEASVAEALRIDPYDGAAWDLAGRLMTGKREFPKGLFNFERAIRYRPAFAPYLYDYALALASAGEPDRAKEAVEEALRAPGSELPEAHALLAGLLARQGRLGEAAAEYRLALKLKPEFARAHLDLASVLVAQGDRQGAIQELKAAAGSADPEVRRLAFVGLERLGAR